MFIWYFLFFIIFVTFCFNVSRPSTLFCLTAICGFFPFLSLSSINVVTDRMDAQTFAHIVRGVCRNLVVSVGKPKIGSVRNVV